MSPSTDPTTMPIGPVSGRGIIAGQGSGVMDLPPPVGGSSGTMAIFQRGGLDQRISSGTSGPQAQPPNPISCSCTCE